jgi:hypothetical protein
MVARYQSSDRVLNGISNRTEFTIWPGFCP